MSTASRILNSPPDWSLASLQRWLKFFYLASLSLLIILTLESQLQFYEAPNLDGLVTFLCGLGALSLGLFLLALRTYVLFFGPASADRHPVWPQLLCLPIAMAALWASGEYDVPVRLAFAVSRSNFESSRPQSGYGGVIRGPSLYKIQEVQTCLDGTRFVVGKSEGLLWDYSYGGFAYCPNGPAAYVFPMPSKEEEGHGSVTYHALGDGWYWWRMDLSNFAYNETQ